MDAKPEGKVPNYVGVIRDIISSLNGVVSTEDLVDQILRRRPSSAKYPRRAALAKISEVEV